MADEVLDGQGAVDAEAVTEEVAETVEETTEPNPIEALAADLGWTPKDKFRGDAEKWKPADEFIRASRDINQNLHREIRGLRDQVGQMATVSSRILADKIAERDSYWQGIHEKAVEDGDKDLARRAVSELGKIEEEKRTATPESTLPPETAAFVERNSKWFNVDPLATMRAQEVAEALAKRGIPVAEQLTQAERAIRKEFPEHFPTAAKQPAAVQTGQARNPGTGSRKKGFADMPAESQKMAQTYKEEHGIPLEKFAESYWQDQERKVG